VTVSKKTPEIEIESCHVGFEKPSPVVAHFYPFSAWPPWDTNNNNNNQKATDGIRTKVRV